MHGPAALVERPGDGVAVAGNRCHTELVAEDEGEDEAEPNRMGRDPDQHQEHGEAVEERPGPEGREDPDRDRDHEDEERSAGDERGGHRQGLVDHPAHLLAVDVRVAERPVAEEIPDEAPVLLPDRLVEVEELADELDRSRRGSAAGRESGGVARHQEEDRVRDDGHGEDEHDRP